MLILVALDLPMSHPCNTCSAARSSLILVTLQVKMKTMDKMEKEQN